MVDVFRTVITVEATNHKRECVHHRLQHWQQKQFADALHRTDRLTLCDFIHCIDEVNALDAVQIALVHAVYAQIAWSTIREWFAPFANVDSGRRGLVE
jgi:hypothetical protein